MKERGMVGRTELDRDGEEGREGDRERGWSQAGTSSGASCEEAPSVHGSAASVQTEQGPRQTWAPIIWPI